MKSRTKEKFKSYFAATLLILILPLVFAACASSVPENPSSQVDELPIAQSAENTEAPQEKSAQPSSSAVITADREGNPITLPENIEKIISLGPSNTEILIALGVSDKIIATDDYSPKVGEGEIETFSMLTPDVERIVSLAPDVIFVTGMSKVGGEDPFKLVADTGVSIIYIPSSTSIDDIKEDIRFIAKVMRENEKGNAIVADMEKEIENIRQAGADVTEKKTVYFEIAAAPAMYSFGGSTFLNEMIEIIGAENVFAAEESGWLSVSDESVVSANPDVILTSVNYIDDPVGEIKSRAGWADIKAVRDNAVYYIDTDASNRPSQNIIKALTEMAAAVYPDLYRKLG